MEEELTITPETEEETAVQEPVQEPAQETVVVADIHFRNNSKVYFFDPGQLTLTAGDHVIIETARGPEYGIVSAGNHPIPAKDVVSPLRAVLRRATPADEKIAADNTEKEKRAFKICLQKIADHKLDMQLVSAEYAFDGSKILFFFTADDRVDFRELVKNLASIFHTRIELRQIGVRDKAKMVGGLGICGRPFCCGEFLNDFQPVSIKMAKTQNLSLNPTKISGTCGRLMCCLKYEQEAYEDLLRTSPKPDSFVDTPDGRGTVTEVNLLRQSVKVRMENQTDTIGCYRNCDICVLRNGKAKKNDPPIPADLAPISGGGGVRRKFKEPEAEPQVALQAVKYRGENIAPERVAPTEEVSAEEAQTKQNRRKKRPERKPDGSQAEVPQGEKPQERAPKKEFHNNRRPRKPQGEEGQQPKKPQDKERPVKHPNQDAKPRQGESAEKPKAENGEAPNKPRRNNNRRHYNRRPKEGNKPQSGGQEG